MEHYRVKNPKITAWDRQLALPMFVCGLLFLIATGFLVPTLVYIDPVDEANEPAVTAPANISVDNLADIAQPVSHAELIYFDPTFRLVLLILMGGLYLLLIAEFLLHFVTGGKNLKQHILFLVFPFMRICFRDHRKGGHVWVPGMGWLKSNRLLERRLTEAFGVPMILIALPIIPLVITQLVWADRVNSNLSLKFLLATTTALIWMAFTFEFAVMFTVHRRKFKYCKENWINLVVIAMPLVGFLRLAALGGLLKVNQVARAVSVFRLRGLAIRFWKAILALELIDKALRKTPQQRIERLKLMIIEREEELALLRWQMKEIESLIEVEEDENRSS